MNTQRTKTLQTIARQRRIKVAQKRIAERERRIRQRNKHTVENNKRPMMSAAGIQYEVADRNTATSYGGIGLIHSLAQQCGLVDAINSNVRLLQNYFPYHESDHVLNIADNAMAWSLKAWLAQSVSATGRWKIRRREEKFQCCIPQSGCEWWLEQQRDGLCERFQFFDDLHHVLHGVRS